jgi:hypothetical protein
MNLGPSTVQRPLSSLESPCSLTQCRQCSDAGLDCAFIPVHSGFLSGLASSTFFFTSSLADGFWLVSFATGRSPIKNIPRLANIKRQSSSRLRMVSPSEVGEKPAIRKNECQLFDRRSSEKAEGRERWRKGHRLMQAGWNLVGHLNLGTLSNHLSQFPRVRSRRGRYYPRNRGRLGRGSQD